MSKPKFKVIHEFYSPKYTSNYRIIAGTDGGGYNSKGHNSYYLQVSELDEVGGLRWANSSTIHGVVAEEIERLINLVPVPKARESCGCLKLDIE